MSLGAYVEGVGVLGPGLPDWREAARIFRDPGAYRPTASEVPAPSILPVAERRRTGRVVRLALAVALDAIRGAGIDPAQLPSVFASSGGDGANCHEICTALAEPPRELSPTRFTNSVHNLVAGYWSIAVGAMRPSQTLCAYDASFAAGLLEALVGVAIEREPVLLVGYDAPYPQPLHATRPIAAEFGVALVLAPRPTARSIARIDASIAAGEAQILDDAPLEALRRGAPAARSLPLLAALALGMPRVTTVEYLDSDGLRVQVSPCD
ncbi:MAG: beta-ketoacyl synthase chain length factor [Gammaproteobacteria bacterium]|nr:beta-ketoacyl synthase chain length factor [Gammaproteobacteria bacterium]